MSATGSRETEESEAVFTREVGDEREEDVNYKSPMTQMVSVTKGKRSFETHRNELAVTARRDGSGQEE